MKTYQYKISIKKEPDYLIKLYKVLNKNKRTKN